MSSVLKTPKPDQLTQSKVIIVPAQQPQKSQVEQIVPYLPLLLTILGWHIVSKQNDKRERRKEIRDLIKLIEQKADAVLSTATEYYSINGIDKKCPELETRIRYHLEAIKSLEGRIKKAGLSVTLKDERVGLKQSVTGNEFESRARKKINENNVIISEVAAASVALMEKLENAYFQSYPVRFGWNPFLKN